MSEKKYTKMLHNTTCKHNYQYRQSLRAPLYTAWQSKSVSILFMSLLIGIASASTMTLGTCAGKIKVAWCKSDDNALLYTSLGLTNNFILDKNSGRIKKIFVIQKNGYKWEAEVQPENYWLFTVTTNGVSSTYRDGECTTTMPIKQHGSTKDCQKLMQSYNMHSKRGKN